MARFAGTVRRYILVTLALVVAVPLVGPPGIAVADTAPANDTEAAAVVAETVPFTHSVDTTDATADGPRFCGNQASVFYRFVPSSNARVQIDTLGSQYDTTLGVYTRGDDGTVHGIVCNDDRFGFASGIRLRADAGTTYFLLVGRCCGSVRDGNEGAPGGPLVITLSEIDSVPLEYTFEIAQSGTVDPTTRLATVSGFVTCSKRSVIFQEGVLRQVRDQIFLARGWMYAQVGCTPDAPVPWTLLVDTDTSVVFGPGAALIRMTYGYGSNGFREYVQNDPEPMNVVIQLA
jgi:hypothetical protein